MEYKIVYTDPEQGHPVLAFAPHCGAVHFSGESGIRYGLEAYKSDITRNLHRILSVMDSDEWEDADEDGVAQYVCVRLDNGDNIRVYRYL